MHLGVSTERLWALAAGILFGAGVGGHALRLVVLEGGLGARHLVAGAACLLYGVAALLTFLEKKAGLWITVIGPMVGISAVLLAPNASVDAFQITLGVFQAVATLIALVVLWRTRR